MVMTSRERVAKALKFEEVDRIPIENAFRELAQKYPSDVAGPNYRYPVGRRCGVPYKQGRHTDIWGCVWEAGEDDVKGEVIDPLLQVDWSRLKTYQPPWEIHQGADLSLVNPSCTTSDKFMISMWDDSMPHPFERMQHLRGSEQLFLDLAYLEPEVYLLRDMVHDFFMKQLALWVKTDVDGIQIADDWGAQQALLISPDLWRSFFKPLYRDYCDLAHAHGKFVLMHSDGYILDIIPDLIEIGVNAVNSQLFCMPVETLAERFAGKMCFWGEIDRQRLLPFGTPEDVRAAVRRVAKAFMRTKRTGLVGQVHGGKGYRPENIEAAYDEWSKV